ncbi:MAG: hypothetical protein ACTSXJ_02165 [Candidatus Baldrarchaeia archaeon]
MKRLLAQAYLHKLVEKIDELLMKDVEEETLKLKILSLLTPSELIDILLMLRRSAITAPATNN